MNKTVNINIGGLFFNVDENAYQKLARYFDAIKRSLNNSSGQDEIMNDIENRVAELLAENQKSDKHAVNLQDVDAVISVMGQPEDYRIEDEEPTTKKSFTSTGRTSKKLYRDKDNSMIAGVCSGLAHYFGVDAVWIKIGFVITVIAGFGAGILAYIILWIVTPEAQTTSEKIEMMGEPVNISNIEKKVRQEFEHVSDNLKNVGQNIKDEMGNVSENFKNSNYSETVKKTSSNLGDVIITIFKAFAKVLGAFISFFAAFSLIGILIACIIMAFSSTMPDNFIINHISTPIGLETPLWIQAILFVFALGIPFFFMLILGLKLLVTNLKSIGNVAKYSLLGIWIVSVGILIALGINEFSQLAFDAKVVDKQVIELKSTDTLNIKFKNNDYYSKDSNDRNDFRLTQNEKGEDIIYSNNVEIEIKSTDEPKAFLQIEKIARGKSNSEAKSKAEKISYGFQIENNNLILDNYLLTKSVNKFRGQEVQLTLYLPKGTYFKPDASMADYDDTDSDYFYWHPNENEIYRVGDTKINCINCKGEDGDWDSEEIKTEDISLINENDSIKEISLKINGKEVIQTKKGKPGLEINEDGIIVKTK